jgi:hypothetical protein
MSIVIVAIPFLSQPHHSGGRSLSLFWCIMRRILCVSLGLLLLLGCTSKRNKPVAGTLTYKGQPVGNVVLRLIPVSGVADVPIPVNQEGKFSTTGIVPGEYKGVVESAGGRPPADPRRPTMSTQGMDPAKAQEMEQKLAAIQGSPSAPTVDYPAKYKRGETTDLKVTITEGGNPNLELTLTD